MREIRITFPTEGIVSPKNMFEGHSRLVSYLAYPGDADRREDLILAMRMFRGRSDRSALPRGRRMPLDEAETKIEQAMARILRDRFPAAEIFLSCYFDWDEPGGLMGHREASQNVAAALNDMDKLFGTRPGMRRIGGNWTEDNVLTKKWAASKPVLHLATAALFVANSEEDPQILFNSHRWVMKALLIAEAFRLLGPKIEKKRRGAWNGEGTVNRDEMIRFTPTVVPANLKAITLYDICVPVFGDVEKAVSFTDMTESFYFST